MLGTIRYRFRDERDKISYCTAYRIFSSGPIVWTGPLESLRGALASVSSASLYAADVRFTVQFPWVPPIGPRPVTRGIVVYYENASGDSGELLWLPAVAPDADLTDIDALMIAHFVDRDGDPLLARVGVREYVSE
jgi:hypothetical protein